MSSKRTSERHDKLISSQEKVNTRFSPSFTSNSKTKITNDSSNNPTNAHVSMSNYPNSWNSSHTMSKNEGSTRNTNLNTHSLYTMTPSTLDKRAKEEYNFTSADLKDQYLSHGSSSRKQDSTPDNKVSKKPPVHKKQPRESGDKSNRIPKQKQKHINKMPPMSSASAIDAILQGVELNMDPMDLRLPNEESTKYSSKKNGIISGYAANTNQGLIRNYNEDRVSIILNIVKPKGKENVAKWPKCSFFAVYDGHGGSVCADFLKDNLHQFIVRQECFPEDVKTAIRLG